MAKKPATVFELRKAAEATDQKINAAVDAVLADLVTKANVLAKAGSSTSSRRCARTRSQPRV